MRIQLSQPAVQLLYRLGADDRAELRRLMDSLKVDATPAWAIEKESGLYEFFHAGYWIVYTERMIGGERVIVITAVEKN